VQRRITAASPSGQGSANLAYSLALAGETSEARRELAKAVAAARTQYVREDAVAAAYLSLGDRDEAIRWLERGLEADAANITSLNVSELFVELRSDPRFQAIVRRAGLPVVP
jgi:hypothetical protein